MTGFLATMSDDQKRLARDYVGDDTHGIHTRKGAPLNNGYDFLFDDKKLLAHKKTGRIKPA